MKLSTKHRWIGAAGLLFNLWLCGEYNITGLPLLLLTVGYAIAFEWWLVRPILQAEKTQSPSSNAGRAMGNEGPPVSNQTSPPRKTTPMEWVGIVLVCGVLTRVFGALVGIATVAAYHCWLKPKYGATKAIIASGVICGVLTLGASLAWQIYMADQPATGQPTANRLDSINADPFAYDPNFKPPPSDKKNPFDDPKFGSDLLQKQNPR